jgi:hypothetical protein
VSHPAEGYKLERSISKQKAEEIVLSADKVRKELGCKI